MTPYEQQQARQTGVLYAEDHSAIRWPYYFHLVVWTIALAAGIAAAALGGNPNWSLLMSLGIIGLTLAVAFLWQNWPGGIRIDDDGIRIGAVRRRPDPPGRQSWSDYQRWHQMYAP